MKMGLSHIQKNLCDCIKVMGKEKPFGPKFDSTLFVNMLVGRKLYPPCPTFIKVHSTMLRIVNMLKMKCFTFPKVCWTRLCKVWHMRVFKKSFNLSQFSTYSKMESSCLNIKAWRLVANLSNEKLSTKHLCDNIGCP